MECQACGHAGVEIWDICSECKWENDSNLEQYFDNLNDAEKLHASIPDSMIHNHLAECGHCIVTVSVEPNLITEYRDWWSTANGSSPNEHMLKRNKENT